MVLWPLYASSTTLCICLLSLPCHFCRSCHVSFCYVSFVSMLTLRNMKGVGFRACTTFSYFFMGLDIALAKALVHLAHWASAPITSFLVVPIGLQTVIPAMLTHWDNYLFPWASLAYLLCFYLLLCLWACWLLFLPCWPIGLITSFYFLSLPSFPIVGLLLLLGSL